MLENDYKYELKYVHKDKVCNISFNGEITFDELVSNLQNFLYSCGWSEDTVKRQIKTESDLWEESEKEEDNSEREDLKPEYYKTANNCGEYKNNVNYCHGYDPDKDYYKNTVNNE